MAIIKQMCCWNFGISDVFNTVTKRGMRGRGLVGSGGKQEGWSQCRELLERREQRIWKLGQILHMEYRAVFGE